MTTNNSCDQNQTGYQVNSGTGTFYGRSIVAGNGSITVTNGDGIAGNTTIIANSSGTGLTWSVVTGATQSATVGSGYIANNSGTLTITLPATSNPGDQIGVMGINNNTGWKIAQNAGNQIFIGNLSTTSGTGGYIQSTQTSDSIVLMCVTANAKWQSFAPQGNITLV